MSEAFPLPPLPKLPRNQVKKPIRLLPPLSTFERREALHLFPFFPFSFFPN